MQHIMIGKLLALLGFASIVAAGAALAAQNADLPLDAPDDAVMASADAVQEVADWASEALLGNPPLKAADAFIEPAMPFAFVYGGTDSKQLLETWKRTVASSDEKDRVRHQVVWTDPKTKLQVTAEASCFKRYPAVDWVLYFENQGDQDTPIIENIQALDLVLQTANVKQPGVLHRLTGDEMNERSFLPFETPIEVGKTISMAPVGGRPSNSSAFPFFNVEYANRGTIVAIGWSGQWAASLERTAAGPTRLRAGMEKTHLVLHPGEKIRSPRVLLMPWTGDRIAAHQRFRRLMMFHYAPRPAGRPLRLPFALQCFDRYRRLPGWATAAGQIASAEAAQELGFDTLWYDAAWFVGDFPNGVGNWFHKTQEFPDGLKPVSDACHRLGMKFILWFEPEHVASGTQIAEEHPEFVFGGKEGGLFRLFRLDDPAARRWLTDTLSQRITEYGVDVYRNDFNLDPLDYWRQSDAPDREGMTEIRYVEGIYAMWDELLAKHPGLWIDNCASGGKRIDLEICMRSVPLWRSDTNCSPGHLDWNQTQTQGLSLYLPLFTACSWSPESYAVRSAATGGLIGEFGYLDKGFPEDLAKATVAEAKENQKYWYGDFTPLTQAVLSDDQWAAYQLHRADLNAGLVLAFRRAACPYSAMSVELRAIDPAKDYVVEFVDDTRNRIEKTISGRELTAGLELRLPSKQSSLVVRYRSLSQ